MAIDSWPAWCKYPLGHYVKTLGEKGAKATETEVSATSTSSSKLYLCPNCSIRHQPVAVVAAVCIWCFIVSTHPALRLFSGGLFAFFV